MGRIVGSIKILMRKNVPSGKSFAFQAKLLLHALALCLTLFFSFSATAQSQLIKDVNTTEDPFPLEYSELVSDPNGNVYFISRGKELWKTNSSVTSQTAVMLRSMRSISNLTVSGSSLFFVGEDGAGKELWKTNGSGSTTRKVKEIRSGSTGSNPTGLTNVNGILYFAADNGVNGNELWKSDGTEAGTSMVRDINAGATGSHPSSIEALNGVIYFSAHDGTSGFELWRTNGTASGTTLVKDINPGKANAIPAQLTAGNGKLYFVANAPATGRELWISDGSTTGTRLLKDIRPGTEASDITEITALKEYVYFSADDGTHGYQLWRSDASNAVSLSSFDPYNYDDTYKLYFLRAVEDALYFSKYTNDYEIFRFNPVTGSMQAIHQTENNINPRYSIAGGSIYFFSYYFDQDLYRPFFQLRRINSTGTGTILVRNFPFEEDWFGGLTPDYKPEMVSANNQLYFYAILNEGEGYKMLRSDGTRDGTVILKDTYVPTQSSHPDGFVTFQGITYFTAAGTHPYFNTDVWRTDGTLEGTFRLHRFGYIPEIKISGSTVYFMGTNSNHAYELWKTNGSLAGTVMIKDFDPSFYFGIVGLVDVYGTLYFADAEKGQLWKSDGTAAGTVMLKDFYRIKYIGKGGGRAIFSVINVDGTDELWRSSGTTNSTAKLKSIKFTGGAQSNDTKRVTVNDLFYFFADDGVRGVELWRSDGTTSGTYMVKDLRANDGAENDFYALTGFRDSLYFTGKTTDHTYSLFKTNGTNAGTSKVVDIPFTNDVVPSINRLLLFAKSGDGSELWSTDGTASGTVYITHLDSMQFESVTHVSVNDATYFSWTESPVLWRSDGTDCGTYTIDTPGKPYPVGINGTNLLFGAETTMFGREPHRLSVLALPDSPCGTSMALQPSIVQLKATEYSPNPFTEKVTLRITAAAAPATIVVKTFTGDIIHTLHDVRGDTDYELGQNWPRGLYVVNVVVDGKSESFRLIKK